MGPALIAFFTAFLGSAVESVEALTVLIAVGVTRGWRSALEGTAVGLLIMAVLVVTLGGVLVSRLPEATLKLVVGTLILLFGIRWLRKAILRAAGVLAKHDEQHEYEETVHRLAGGTRGRRDHAAFAISLQAVLLEGTELGLAALGGGLAVAMVAGAGIALRRPLARVPENTLKYTVGVALSALGTFWAIEGMGYSWPLDVLSMAPLVLIYLAASWLALLALRASKPASLAKTA
jgi:uncharacterized membrane protein